MGNNPCSLPLNKTVLDRDLVRYLTKRHGCRTIGDVVGLTGRRFNRLRGRDEATWRCINRALSFHGLPEIGNDLEAVAK